MKVIAIGGSGGMGRAMVRAALTYEFITEIVVAGIDFDLARELLTCSVLSLHWPWMRLIRLFRPGSSLVPSTMMTALRNRRKRGMSMLPQCI